MRCKLPNWRRRQYYAPINLMKKSIFAKRRQIKTGNTDWEMITKHATAFVNEWKNENRENAESQTFWNQFFEIFGRSRRGLAIYEYHAKRNPRLSGRIDLLWKGVLAVEHKSAANSLDEGEQQLHDYILNLSDEDKPRYGLVCNFRHFRLIGFQEKQIYNFPLAELPDNVKLFEFFIEHERQQFVLELQASMDAVALMGDIYDALINVNYQGEIDRLLVRLLFCMFAEDTGIFNRRAFFDYVDKTTAADGGNLGPQLEWFFNILNTPPAERQKTPNSMIENLPFVNGKLFAQSIGMAAFDRQTRQTLLEACLFDWSKISPDIFGALFQSVNDDKRRESGAHYTSEDNIMKVIAPLFLDELYAELNLAADDDAALQQLHDKIAALRFLDPACGCGNFLIVAYRELRRLETEILRRIYAYQSVQNLDNICRVKVSQFYGIEIDSFPAHIAEAAMWLVDHQMNMEASNILGGHLSRIPLTISPTIVHANALETDWRTIVMPKHLSYILGNPPFVGNYLRGKTQKADMERIFNGNGAGVLDYVCAWYMKAACYIADTDIRCAFVSTNSITQGEQVAPLWNLLYAKGIKIHFAHRTFRWNNDSDGDAHVYVVIIGFGNHVAKQKYIYDYADIRGKPNKRAAKNINAYIQDAPDILIAPRRQPICDMPLMMRGSGPTDNGNFLFSEKEKRDFLKIAPTAAPFMRRVISGKEYLSGKRRWCLWLAEVKPEAYKKIPAIQERVDKVKSFRENSKAVTAKKNAKTPHLFQSIRQPGKNYLLVPRVSSENRQYLALGFIPKDYIALDSCIMLPDGNLYHFGVMSSSMHMTWVRAVAGRLKSDYRYSNTLVYNTFPWPQNITVAQKDKIAACARAVLEARKNHNLTLGKMYSIMPPNVLSAHQSLDRAVDRAYRREKFADENARLVFLFDEYRRLSAQSSPTRASEMFQPHNKKEKNHEQKRYERRTHFTQTEVSVH